MTAVQTSASQIELITRCVALLERWAAHAEKTWTWLSPADATRFSTRRRVAQNAHPMPEEPVAGYYGTGYASWGVMAQAATVGVFGALTVATGKKSYLERCCKGLRFLFGTHAAGPLRLTDGAKWGSGISGYDEQYAALWLEQGMLAYDLVEKHMAPYDRALIKSVLTTEADCYLAHRITGGLGPEAGRAETNAWKAGVLARAARLFPDHQHAEQWRQKSCSFWLNAISVESDAQDPSMVLGLSVRDWHRVSNFHAHYGVTHRGFFHPSDIALTLGVMALTALMHTRRGAQVPVETFHHWHEALAVIKQLYLWDDTVACVGGQTWPRFTWDQSMVLPALVWAGTHRSLGPAGDTPVLNPAQALEMANGIISRISAEQEANGDGSFFSCRLSALREETEWDYLRYEAGTAFALATVYAVLTTAADVACQSTAQVRSYGAPSDPTFAAKNETSAAYREPSLGAIWHRGEYRFASWCWQACRVPAQGLVIPRSSTRLAEWNSNMVGVTRLKEHEEYHALQYHREHQFAGGFATLGLLAEQLPMWPMADKTPSLRHGIAFWALPDGYTCILLDLVWCERQVNVVQNRGILYKLANDITNGNQRKISCAQGERLIQGVGAKAEIWRPDAKWLVIDDSLLITTFWGGQLAVDIRGARMPARHGYGEATLLWDEICAPLQVQRMRLQAGDIMRDICAAYVCEVNGKDGGAVAARLSAVPLPIQAKQSLEPHARASLIRDREGVEYLVAANFDRETATIALPLGWQPLVLAGDAKPQYNQLALPPASLTLCVRNS